MLHERRTNYGLNFWAQGGLKAYAGTLTTGKKIGVLGAMLKNFCGLTPNELQIFMLPEQTPAKMDAATRSLDLARATKKIGDFYSGATPFPEGDEFRKRKVDFDADVKDALKEMHDTATLNEILFYMNDPINLAVMVQELVRDVPAYRRVRNAYLPEITDVVTQVFSPENGKMIAAFDSAPSFDDPQRDSVQQIEDLLFGRRS